MKLKTKLFLFLSVLFVILMAVFWYYSKEWSDDINEKWGERFVKKQIIFDKNRTLLPIVREMEMIREMAADKAIIGMALDENDPKVYARGIAALEKYRNQFEDRSYFAAFTNTQHYYYNDAQNTYKGKELQYTLSSANKNDSWFFTTIATIDDIGINVDRDHVLGITKIWFNCLVKDNGKIIGVVGTGFDFDRFIRESVAIEQEGVKNFFIDRQMAIQLAKDADVIDYASITKADGEHKTMETLFQDPNDVQRVKQVLRELDAVDTDDYVKTVWVTFDGKKQLLGISYLKEIGWYSLTLIDSKELILVDNIKNFIILSLLLLIALVLLNYLVNRIFIKPLNLLQAQMIKVEQGEYDNIVLPEVGSGEIADLSGHFKKMIEYVNINNRNLEEKIRERTTGLAESERKFRALFDSTHDAVMLLDENGFLECNEAAVQAFECSCTNELCSLNPTDLSPAFQPDGSDSGTAAWEHIQTALRTGYDHFEWLHKRVQSGTAFYGEVTLNAVSIGERRIIQAVIRDIDARKKAEMEIQQLAFYDALTRLPNRRLMNDRIFQAMALSKRNKRYGALIFLDLDNFKPLNDRYGHEVGDQLLVMAAERLSGCVREVDTVARFGGDEFVILLGDLSAERDEAAGYARTVAEKIRLSVEKSYKLRLDETEGNVVEYQCTASIGGTLFYDDSESKNEILSRADQAMYAAKQAGRNRINFI